MLSTRELTLVLRARDEASRVLRGVGASMGVLSGQAAAAARRSFMHGQALATAGIAVAGAGALAIYALNSMTDAAMAYNQEAAKTLTQTDKVSISLNGVKKMGRDVASTLPVAFEQVQPALYDIFSSIDVNAPQAQKLLMGIGKAAVGGAVDMETSGRITLAILNAWKLGAGGVNHVNDVMFQLVRKGVGTYDQFGKSLGRAIPSALKAGASLEDLSGIMAFLTRNGLSTSMAATSAARAFDAMSNPKTAQHFKAIGISVTDAQGRFRPMVDIIDDMKKKLGNLPPAVRAAKLQELFKGSGGTIQAMRFFNLALADSHDLLGTMTDDMHNANGAAAEAFKTMSNTPQAQLQLLSNRYQVMATIIGDSLIPAKMALVKVLSTIVGWFLNLSPQLQSTIIKFAAIAAGAAILMGVLMAIVGVWMMFSAAVALAGFTVGTVIAVVAGIVAGLAALVAVGILVYKNWDTIKAHAISSWKAIQPMVMNAWNAIKTFATGVWNSLVALWNIVQPAAAKAWQYIRDVIVRFATEAWTFLKNAWNAVFPTLVSGWNTIKDAVTNTINTLAPYWQQLVAAWDNLLSHSKAVGQGIADWIGRLYSVVQPLLWGIGQLFVGMWNIIQPILYALVAVLGGVWQAIANTFAAVWGAISSFVGNVMQILSGLINFFVAVFTGNWSAAWDAILQIVKGIWGAISAVIVGARDVIWGIVEGFINGIIGFFQRLYNILVGNSIIPDMVNAIIHWFATLPGRVWAYISDLVARAISGFAHLAAQAVALVATLASRVVSGFASLSSRAIGVVIVFVARIISFFTNMFSNVGGVVSRGISAVVSFMSALPGRVMSAVSSLSGRMLTAGHNWLQNALNGCRSVWGAIYGFFSGLPSRILGALGNLGGLLWNAGWSIMRGLFDGIRNGFGMVQNFIGSIGSWISSHKGPKAYDLKLLQPHGGWIMQGLRRGIRNDLPKLESLLSKVADTVAGTAFPEPPVDFGATGPRGPSTGNAPGNPPAGVQIPIVVNTQEIDPLKHAADLGYAIAGRLGL